MNKRKRITIGAICLSILLLGSLFSGCESKAGPKESAEESYAVNLYFVNEDYVVTGDETLPVMQPVYESTVTALPEAVYLATMEKLATSPKAGYDTMLGDGVTINSVILKDGIASVDFDSKTLNGGSLAETMIVNQVVMSLMSSFDEVKGVVFTLDGKETESLMGHMDMQKPFILSVPEKEGEPVTVVQAEQ